MTENKVVYLISGNTNPSKGKKVIKFAKKQVIITKYEKPSN